MPRDTTSDMFLIFLEATKELRTARMRPVMTIDDAVRVQTRYQFENILVSKQLGSRVVGIGNKVKESLKYETRWSLARMNSGTYKTNALFTLLVMSRHRHPPSREQGALWRRTYLLLISDCNT